MTDITALIERLVASGADPIVAACVVAEAVVSGKNTSPYRDDVPDTRSKAAIRQQAYRDRQKASLNVTRDVTGVTHNERDDNVTKRNEGVTEHNENVTALRTGENAHISYLPSSSNSQEKKESKKERKPRKRNAPLCPDWAPSLHSYQVAEQCGQNVQIVEQIFRDYLKSSGKLYADYDAAFNNFIRNQQRFNRGTSNGNTQNSRGGGSLIDALDRRIAEAELAEKSDLALPTGAVLSLPNRSIR